MASHVTYKNTLFGLILLAGLVGSSYEAYQYWQIDRINQAILTDTQFETEIYPYQEKFATAYHQGNKQQYLHAIDIYNQLLETDIPPQEQAKVQFNIANNLFVFGLLRKINDDGSLVDEARYAFSQARLAYEQSLRMNPSLRPTKLNLSLLNSVMPKDMQGGEKEQSSMELSNLPIGLP